MNSSDSVIMDKHFTLMNFNWELSEFSITSRHKCHILMTSYFEYYFKTYDIDRKEVPAKTELLIRNTKKFGRGWHVVEKYCNLWVVINYK